MSENIEKLTVEDFLRISSLVPIIDVRSPGEYAYGHIPGSHCIPLFTDEQRAIVGTVYKKKGNLDAVKAGIELASPDMSSKLQAAIDMTVEGRLLVHCWRGGMRSEAMAWLFSLGGIKPYVLKGGYKAYRNYVLSDLQRDRKIIVLGGLTGSGKTHILQYISSKSVQVTDLEGLASHKGSAFGALGQLPQPSSEHFANLLFADLYSKNADAATWLEDESKNIGTVFLPDGFYNAMQRSPVIALMMNIDTRLPRLIAEYTTFPKEAITASIIRISKRLGGDKTKSALDAIGKSDYETAIRIVLEYYDKAYNYGLSKRKKGQIIFVETDTDNVEVNASRIIEAAASIV